MTMQTMHSYWRAATWMVAAAIMFSACGRRGDDRQHVTALIAASEQMLEQENVDSAWALLEHAYDEASRHHDGCALAETCLAMARHHNMMDRPDSAIASLKRGLAIYPEAHDSLLAQYYAPVLSDSHFPDGLSSCALPVILNLIIMIVCIYCVYFLTY